MKPLSERWLGPVDRPPAGSFGRLFRLDLASGTKAGAGWQERRGLADGVIAPDGAAFARIRGSGAVVFAPDGLEALVASLDDPSIRVVFQECDGEL